MPSRAGHHAEKRRGRCRAALVAACLGAACTLTLDPLPEPCGPSADEHVLALYRFEEPAGELRLSDAVGALSGEIAAAAPPAIERRGGYCGQGLYVSRPLPADAFAALPADARWRVPIGSVDLRVRFDRLSGADGARGILTRTSKVTHDGDLVVLRACDGSIVAKLAVPGAGNRVIHRCSAPVPDEVWQHIGINFGAPDLELHVEGRRAQRTGPVTLGSTCNTTAQCSSETIAHGIDGNDDAWVLGAIGAGDAEGQAGPVRDGLGGILDELRISAVRRDYAGAP